MPTAVQTPGASNSGAAGTRPRTAAATTATTVQIARKAISTFISLSSSAYPPDASRTAQHASKISPHSKGLKSAGKSCAAIPPVTTVSTAVVGMLRQKAMSR
jgi:hypothetical protein